MPLDDESSLIFSYESLPKSYMVGSVTKKANASFLQRHCSRDLVYPTPWSRYCAEVESSRTSLASRTSSRTHFEVLGLGLGLEAPSPWPRSLKSSKIALSSARGQHYFFEQLKFRWKTLETSRKICEHLFCFPHLEHRRRQGRGARPPPQLKFHQWQKSLLFLQFQFLFSIFCWQQYN